MSDLDAVTAEINSVKAEIKALAGHNDDLSRQMEVALYRRLAALLEEKMLLMQRQGNGLVSICLAGHAGTFSRLVSWYHTSGCDSPGQLQEPLLAVVPAAVPCTWVHADYRAFITVI